MSVGQGGRSFLDGAESQKNPELAQELLIGSILEYHQMTMPHWPALIIIQAQAQQRQEGGDQLLAIEMGTVPASGAG